MLASEAHGSAPSLRVEMLLLIADAHLRLTKYEIALEGFLAISSLPDSDANARTRSWFGTALAYEGLGRWPEASRQYSIVLATECVPVAAPALFRFDPRPASEPESLFPSLDLCRSAARRWSKTAPPNCVLAAVEAGHGVDAETAVRLQSVTPEDLEGDDDEEAAAAPILTLRELRELGCDVERALEWLELPDSCPPGSLRWRR